VAHILVVDDEPMVRRTLRAALELAGHTVAEAEDGDSCLGAVRERAPDLILMDIIMPNREGVETITVLRQTGFAAPIVAISGGGRTGGMLFLETAAMLGATRTLPKPVRNADLMKTIADCLAPQAA
jgi:CheY-like chemotaxis protein